MGDKSGVYGVGGRLKQPPDPLLVDSAYKHDNSYAHFLMDDLHDVDIAYVCMLIKQNIIPSSEGKKLLSALINIKKVDFNEYIDFRSGDIYNSKEKYLSSKIGSLSGWMHIGRPRREAINTAFLMSVRRRLLTLLRDMISLANALIHVSKKEINTIVSDYTYLYQSTPTTFGHYILTFYYPLIRDIEKVLITYERFNQCPLGCGISNGSNLNLDRDYLSEILCFKKPISHARDAMWQPDLPANVISDVTMVFMNLSRLAEELQIFNSVEFSIVELPDSLCRTSVIMPQKKNPYPLTYIRGLANLLIGKMVSSISYGKVFSGNPDSRIFAYNDVPEVLDRSSEGIKLFAKVIETLKVNKAKALDNLEQGYTFASELSEFLSTRYAIDYKTSHEIVGFIVRQMIDKKISNLDIDIVRKAIFSKTGLSVEMSSQELSSIIDPTTLLKGRITYGSASPKMLNKLLEDEIPRLNILKIRIEELEQSLNFNKLNLEIKEII